MTFPHLVDDPGQPLHQAVRAQVVGQVVQLGHRPVDLQLREHAFDHRHVLRGQALQTVHDLGH